MFPLQCAALPEEKIEKNLAAMAELKDHPWLSGEGWQAYCSARRNLIQVMRKVGLGNRYDLLPPGIFQSRVERLFPCFDGVGGYVKSLMQKTDLPQDHDAQLGLLEQALEKMDLATVSDITNLAGLSLNEGGWAGVNYEIFQQFYEGLEGKMSLARLKRRPVELCLEKRKEEQREKTALQMVVPLVPPFLVYAFHEVGGMNVLVLDHLLAGLAAGALFMRGMASIAQRASKLPWEYQLLRTKAARFDQFCDEHMINNVPQ